MRLGSESCRAIGSSLRVEQLLATASEAAQWQMFRDCKAAEKPYKAQKIAQDFQSSGRLW